MDWAYWTNWIINFFYLFWMTSLIGFLVMLLWVLAGKLFERLGYFTVTVSLLKTVTLAWLLFFGYEMYRWWEQDEPDMFVYKGGFVPEKWMEIPGYIFGTVWVLGTAAGLFQYIYRLLQLNRCISKSFPCSTEILAVFEQVKKENKIKKKQISVRCSYTECSARTMRVFHPVILLPVRKLSEEELLIIFRHELMHIKKHDLIYKNLLEILCSLCFLNPAVFWLKKELGIWMEYVCDYKVCRKYGDVKNYYGTILRFAEQSVASPTLTTSLVEKESQLFSRMKKVIKNYRPKKTSKLLLAALLCLLLPATNVVYAFAVESGEAVRKASAANAVEVPRGIGEDNTEDKAEHLLFHADNKHISIGKITHQPVPAGANVCEFDWTFSRHEKFGMPVYYLEKETYIRCSTGGITNGKTIRIVLRQLDDSIRYVDMEAGMVHIFRIKESGNYQFYMENTGTDDVRVLGGCTVYTKQE